MSSRAGFPIALRRLRRKGSIGVPPKPAREAQSRSVGDRVKTRLTVTRHSGGWSAIGNENTLHRAWFHFSWHSPSVWSIMKVFELTRALVDIESITGNEEAVGNYLFDCLAPLAARFQGSVERMPVEAAPLQCVRGVRRPARRHAFHSHGYGAAIHRLARGRDTHLGTRRVRHQGHHRGYDRRGGRPAGIRRTRFRPALRGGRGTQQRRSVYRVAARRAARATSSTANPPKISWPSAPRARCGMK